MKKLNVCLFSLVCTLLGLSLVSCSMSPDMMLKEYNGKLYEVAGDGIYITEGKPSIMTSLIPKDVYRVVAGGTLRFEEARSFFDHKWILKDNKTGQEVTVGNFYIAYVGKPDVDLKAGTYTLSLYVKNWQGRLFMDSATIIVV